MRFDDLIPAAMAGVEKDQQSSFLALVSVYAHSQVHPEIVNGCATCDVFSRAYAMPIDLGACDPGSCAFTWVHLFYDEEDQE